MQADEKARTEAEAKEKADAAKAALDALKEAQAESLKGAEEATAAYDESVMRKHVRHPLLMLPFPKTLFVCRGLNSSDTVYAKYTFHGPWTLHAHDLLCCMHMCHMSSSLVFPCSWWTRSSERSRMLSGRMNASRQRPR